MCEPPRYEDVRSETDSWVPGSSVRTMVTGPSFVSSTDMYAPKRPVGTHRPRSRTISAKRSISGSATDGGAAPVKPGRRPRDVSA
jgi:hypothetical protein